MTTSKRRCAYCNQYHQQDTMVIVGVQAFCSHEHRQLAAQEKALEARSKAASKPKVSKPRSTDNPTPQTRAAVRRRDQDRCRWCGCGGINLHLHHVRYRSETRDHSVGNLITLCQHCHELIHSSKVTYQPILLKLIGLDSRILGKFLAESPQTGQ